MQVKVGSIFDNILIYDDLEYARQVVDETWSANKEVTTGKYIIAKFVRATDLQVTLS
jgi:hypothetical protein